MRLFALHRLPLITAATITVAMGLRIGTLVTSVPTLEALRAEAGNVARVAGSTASGSVVAQAQAAALPGSPAPTVKPPDVKPATAKTEPAPTASSSRQATPSEQATPDAPGGAPFEVPTEAEKALLEDLRGRRGQIETREQALSQREATIGAAEKRLTDRVTELGALQTRLQGLEKSLKDRDDANWASMVKLYETMRPRDAAAIFNVLDKPVLLELLDRMKPAKASPIVAAMDGDKARQATADLAAKRTQSVTLAN